MNVLYLFWDPYSNAFYVVFKFVVHQGKKGAMIGDRYELHSDVGLGTFGRVVECWDLKRRRRVAVKVVRKVGRSISQSLLSK